MSINDYLDNEPTDDHYDDRTLDNLKQELEEYRQEVKKANEFKMSEEEISEYRLQLEDIIPKNLKLSHKHLMLMKYWEKDGSKSLGSLLNDFFGKPTDTKAEEKNLIEWRRNYLQKLVAKCEEYNNLLSQEESLKTKISNIQGHYGISNVDNPLIKEKLPNPMSDLIKHYFGKK